ncbi:HAD family hydrolase [Pseudonocardia acaciae]|uniref:HAD family hydrolase n=1 Tax=Pseudonocardia acaciae TaxID=551276 RepID=UPI001B800321|nr:HAD hydrolase-like protein [Pseudonocardia acaciae]
MLGSDRDHERIEGMAAVGVGVLDQLPKTLVLWDVDHTLIENGGVSKATYSLAFELLTGRLPSGRPVTDGRTDFQIMRELFSANSVAPDRCADLGRIEQALAEAMKRNAPLLPDRGYALPGAADALRALLSVPAVVQSVLTGNIEANAWAKLHAFDLDRLVDLGVGGYGSDSIVRSELVDAAREKVRLKYGEKFGATSTILIGDTPRDIEAARNGGAKIIAVATGASDVSTLQAAGADAVIESLVDLDRFSSVLLEVRTRA